MEKEEIKYYEIDCDTYEGIDNLSDEEKLNMLGYETVEDYEEDGYELDDLDFQFKENYYIDFDEVLEDYNIKVLSGREVGYYVCGCLRCKMVYKIKGKKEDIEKLLKKWFVTDYEEIDLEDEWIND